MDQMVPGSSPGINPEKKGKTVPGVMSKMA